MSSTIGNLSNVYNFYMTSYAPKSSSPYDSHKKSELRRVYNSIVKMNKESPLFILDTSRSSQQFAISVKENARELRNTIASLGGLDEEELLNKKIAYSSNEEIATAIYIGPIEQSDSAPSYDIEVDRLATPQINMGKFLPAEEPVALPADTYSFDVRIEDLNYEFQFSIRSTDTNHTVQSLLARLITNSNVGITARASTDADGYSYLRLESNSTGVKNNRSRIFTISDNRTSKTSGAVDYFGLDYISTPPSNASFLVNGEERSSASNRISLDRTYEVQLTGVSGEGCEFTSIGLKTDVDSLAENVNTLVDGYNTFLNAVSEYKDEQPKSTRLYNEMSGVARTYASDLTTVGLNLNLDGRLEVDDNVLRETAMSDDAKEAFSPMKNFTSSILRKSNQVALDPMNYVNNTSVAYKNPGKNFACPYITSAYSGMMFNGYC